MNKKQIKLLIALNLTGIPTVFVFYLFFMIAQFYLSHTDVVCNHDFDPGTIILFFFVQIDFKWYSHRSFLVNYC